MLENTRVSQIVAVDKNGGISRDGEIPWDSEDDKRHFKETIENERVLMGRLTFEQMGKGSGVIDYFKCKSAHVLSSDESKESEYPEVTWCTDIKDAINELEDERGGFMVLGGSTIYEVMLPYTDKVIVSRLDGEYNCDNFYPIEEMREEFYLIGDIEYGTINVNIYKNKDNLSVQDKELDSDISPEEVKF